MKLSDTQKMITSALLTAILVVVFQVFIALGIPIIVPSVPINQPIGAMATTRNSIICDGGETNCVEARNGKNIVVYSDNGVTEKFKVTGSTGAVSIAGETFSGAIRYGTLATYVSGSSITHGFTTTPTVCIINPMREITATYTITATGFSSDMSSSSNRIYWFCGR